MHTIHFEHGLGDCANFAHMLPLWLNRGHRIGVRCTRDKAPLFRAAGAEIVDKVERVHPWWHAPAPGRPNYDDDWLGNKTGWNLIAAEMPPIGTIEDLWHELATSEIPFEPQVSIEDSAAVAAAIEDLPQPLVLLHSHGNTSPEMKNLSPEVAADLLPQLLDRFPGTVILLDWDSRAPWFGHYRIRHLSQLWGGACNLTRLFALMQRAALLIGIDSGPLHFARLAPINVLGCWSRHFPTHYALPSRRAVHLVTDNWTEWTRRRRHWNLIDAGKQLTATTIADTAARLLAPPIYLPENTPEARARDTLLQHLVARCRGSNGALCSYVDRHTTFHAALLHLKQCPAPRIIETGTIRAEEDWSGAGFSTYLWAAYLDGRNAGALHSVDLSPDNVAFARRVLAPFAAFAEVHQEDSVSFLSCVPEHSAALIYLDSLDTDQPNHAEHCLAEFRAAKHLITNQTILLIDDTTWDGRWRGKGALAVPEAISDRWSFAAAGYQVALRPPALKT